MNRFITLCAQFERNKTFLCTESLWTLTSSRENNRLYSCVSDSSCSRNLPGSTGWLRNDCYFLETLENLSRTLWGPQTLFSLTTNLMLIGKLACCCQTCRIATRNIFWSSTRTTTAVTLPAAVFLCSRRRTKLQTDHNMEEEERMEGERERERREEGEGVGGRKVRTRERELIGGWRREPM